jgi:xanthine dehydrogenase accessory factor
MCYADAIFDGRAELDGVVAERVDDDMLLGDILALHQVIPVIVHEFSFVLERLEPDVLVDARMRKHVLPGNEMHLAPLTIGLGPNFVAGETVHAAVETARGDSLGRVLWLGSTEPLTGEPREIEGHGRDRYVYAPLEGIFQTTREIGDRVEVGEDIARIGDMTLSAPVSGVLRGLTRDGVPVTQKTKVIEIDPRMEKAQLSGIAERPAKIAEGVLLAIKEHRFF